MKTSVKNVGFGSACSRSTAIGWCCLPIRYCGNPVYVRLTPRGLVDIAQESLQDAMLVAIPAADALSLLQSACRAARP